MYGLDCYIMIIRSTNFNPFLLAAAYASCSPPSPASGDGFQDVRAFARKQYSGGRVSYSCSETKEGAECRYNGRSPFFPEQGTAENAAYNE